MDVGQMAIQHVRAQRIFVDYVHIAAAAFLIYDWLLQLNSEFIFIWRSGKWGYTQLIYIIVRYLPLINVYFLLNNQTFVDVGHETCKWTVPVSLVCIDTALVLAELILVIRTWAVWQQDRVVGVSLGLMWIGIVCLALIADINFLKNIDIDLDPYAGFRGCLVTSRFTIKSSSDKTAWGIIVLDTVILVLMTISCYRSYKVGSSGSKFINIIYRDGILFYFFLEGVVICSIVSILVLPLHYELMMEPLLSACYSVFTTRIILNIRSAGQRDHVGDLVALHVAWDDDDRLLTMAFRPADAIRDAESMVSYHV